MSLMERIFLHYVLKTERQLLNLMESIFFQDVLGARNKVMILIDVFLLCYFTELLNESVEESLPPRCTRSKKKGI